MTRPSGVVLCQDSSCLATPDVGVWCPRYGRAASGLASTYEELKGTGSVQRHVRQWLSCRGGGT